MGRITAEIAPGTDHPTLDSIKQRNTVIERFKKNTLSEPWSMASGMSRET